MPEISIIMPSIRPHMINESIRELVQNSPGVDFEILVVSTFPVSGEGVVHIQEQEAGGTVIAANTSYKRAKGDYILCWADDIVPSKGGLKNLLAFVKKHKEPFIGNCRFKGRRGINAFQSQAYGKIFPSWCLASRRTIEMVGGLMDPALKLHLCDVDLGLRVWEKGGSIQVCPNAYVFLKNVSKDVVGKAEDTKKNWEKYFEADAETFLQKWHDKLGKGYERDLSKILRPVPLGLKDDFILSIYTHFVPSIVKTFLKKIDTSKIGRMFGHEIIR